MLGLREPKQREARVRALRMARYAEARVAVVRSLLKRLATLPEAIELGRATGLTLAQVPQQPNLPAFISRAQDCDWLAIIVASFQAG